MQWIIEEQMAKVKELTKKSGGTGGDGGGPGKGKSTDLEKELERLRAENQALKKASAHAASGQAATQDVDQTEQCPEDAEYQQQLDDFEGQLAVLRRLARESGDASFVLATIENLEARAAKVREERRAGWTVPRQFDRQRARVCEREGRVAEAVERVQELEVERAQWEVDMAEARAHLEAKQEGLATERAEITRLTRLEKLLSSQAGAPEPPKNPEKQVID